MREHCIMYAHQGSPKGLPYFLGSAPDRYMKPALSLVFSQVSVYFYANSTMLKTMEERFY